MFANFQDVDTPTMVNFKLPREVAEVEWGLTSTIAGHWASAQLPVDKTKDSF